MDSANSVETAGGPAQSAAVRGAVDRASELLARARAGTGARERRAAERLGRLLPDPAGREVLFALTDEVLRTADAHRSMRQLRDLVRHGLPPALPLVDRAGLRLAAAGSTVAPALVAAAVRRKLRRETSSVIVPADDPAFGRHIAMRRAEGFAINVNLLGEAILGDDEADARLRMLTERMRRADVDYVSVKISALCANLDVLAFEHEVERIVQRLRIVFSVAAEQTPPVFVNLDMEEYRDLDLTVAAFCRVLDEPQFVALAAGIVLQAYLPDAHGVLDRLVEWAARRRRSGGGYLKVRLVKGANLAMEQVDAELGGWEEVTYPSKADVDASYKALLARAYEAAAAGDLRVGVGSHNLFDVGWALEQRAARGLSEVVQIEMLEGMAPAQSRVVRQAAGGALLYTPVVESRDFAASIAYLSRRLDENAGAENFLRALFTIEPGSSEWDAQLDRFQTAVIASQTIGTRPRRTQDRKTERRRFDPESAFDNEPDTDFTGTANREWMLGHLREYVSPTLPELVTTTDGIDVLVARARAAAATWATSRPAERRALLTRIAETVAERRGELIAVMAHETGKIAREGDVEVSEAVDFARWAAASTSTFDDLAGDGVSSEPVGVVLVAGPWNFPAAIPANGVFAALAGGNAVLLKPAPEAVGVAAELVHAIHAAGIPDDLVQLVRCPDDDTGRHLITHAGVGAVVLTGAYETAQLFLGWKPSLHLLAETSGKNALVVSQTADVDLALHDLVRSAFGHAGQKCSAASLAIVEAPLYDDPAFHTRLADAVRSLRVGDASDPATLMGPVITPPTGKLLRGLTQLDAGESWLVEPRQLDDSGRLWSPGVRVGVRAGSWFHRTECFGPVLGVMRADDLDHAIAIQNDVDYGLTGGLHSLDAREIGRWLARVEVGNVYINRHTTGAVVRRQPFGGWKRSTVGRGAKTGGPGDVLRFVRWTTTADPARAEASYRRWWDEMFGVAIDRSGLASESNVLRYRPARSVLVRVGAATTAADIASLRAAARIARCPIAVSGPVAAPGVGIVEDDRQLAARLRTAGIDRLRLLCGPDGGEADDAVLAAAHEAGTAVDRTAVTHHGLVELPCWLREQAISRTLHRHGRIASSPQVDQLAGKHTVARLRAS